MVQYLFFLDELTIPLIDPRAPLKGKLKRLNPFLDKDGVLRVGGRLRHSILPFSQRHGIILPKSDVTTLILTHEHHLQLHAGVQTKLYAV